MLLDRSKSFTAIETIVQKVLTSLLIDLKKEPRILRLDVYEKNINK